eukprot:1146433-Pelagomonas_calceolata.AAC.4
MPEAWSAGLFTDVALDVPDGADVWLDVPEGADLWLDVPEGADVWLDAPEGADAWLDVPEGADVPCWRFQSRSVAWDVLEAVARTLELADLGNVPILYVSPCAQDSLALANTSMEFLNL